MRQVLDIPTSLWELVPFISSEDYGCVERMAPLLHSESNLPLCLHLVNAQVSFQWLGAAK